MSPTVARFVILVVDDNEGIRRMLQSALRALNFEVRAAGSGDEALDLFRRHTIDLVLLDVQMPVMDGPETLARLRQIDPQVRCCFMSGNSGAYTVEELLRRGATHVIQKPFRLADLRQAILDGMANGPRGGAGA